MSLRSSSTLWGAAVVTVLTLFFFSLFFNRFAGIRTVNGSAAAGQAMLAGKLPYRDYFAAAPPFHLIKSAAIMKVFGTKVIVPRAFALFERALLATILYLWLARLFSRIHAIVGAATTIVVSAGDLTDPISSYNHDTILYAVIAGFLASILLDKPLEKWSWCIALMSGVAAGLCLLTKQTIGLGITVALPVLVFAQLWRTHSFALAARFTGLFAAGWLIPNAAIWYWLSAHNLLGDFLRAIFVRGPAAKAGSPLDFIIRWFGVTLGRPLLRYGCLLAMVVMVPTLRVLLTVRKRGARADDSEHLSPKAPLFLLVIGVALIGLGVLAAHLGVPTFTEPIKASIYLTVMANGILATYYSLAFLHRKLSHMEAQFWLFGTVSFISAFMLALSWPAFEAMVMPGLAFLIAAFLDSASARARRWAFAVSALLVLLLTHAKLDAPYGFADWLEPSVREATVSSTLPQMAGFRLPQAQVRMIDETERIIERNTTPKDTIFTFPSMPIFYAISGRWLPTYGGDHNIDACPDDLARADAVRLLKAKPAVIIYYPQAPETLAGEEALWRAGQRSGQRDIIAAIEELVKDYDLAATFDAPPTKLKLQVYVRRREGVTNPEAAGNPSDRGVRLLSSLY